MEKRLSLSRSILADMGEMLNKYRELVTAELRGITQNEVYSLCFSRLIKENLLKEIGAKYCNITNSDEISNAYMLGTDQRDYFLKEINLYSDKLDAVETILDLGAGNGNTSYYLLSLLKRKFQVDIIESNTDYINSYKKMIESKFKNSSCQIIAHEMDKFEKKEHYYDLCFLLHSLNFSDNPKKLLSNVFSSLKKGGIIIIVFADWFGGFTGKICSNFYSIFYPNQQSELQAKIRNRHEIFGISDSDFSVAAAHDRLEKIFESDRFRIQKIEKHASRIFGNDFGDIFASAFITTLPFIEGVDIDDKVRFVSDYVLEKPDELDLCLEVDGLRRGMLSVSQPQYFVMLEKI